MVILHIEIDIDNFNNNEIYICVIWACFQDIKEDLYNGDDVYMQVCVKNVYVWCKCQHCKAWLTHNQMPALYVVICLRKKACLTIPNKK